MAERGGSSGICMLIIQTLADPESGVDMIWLRIKSWTIMSITCKYVEKRDAGRWVTHTIQFMYDSRRNESVGGTPSISRRPAADRETGKQVSKQASSHARSGTTICTKNLSRHHITAPFRSLFGFLRLASDSFVQNQNIQDSNQGFCRNSATFVAAQSQPHSSIARRLSCHG